jgi:hypothetical protein
VITRSDFTRLRRKPRACPWMNAWQGNPPQFYLDEGGYASAGCAEECGGATRLRVGLHVLPLTFWYRSNVLTLAHPNCALITHRRSWRFSKGDLLKRNTTCFRSGLLCGVFLQEALVISSGLVQTPHSKPLPAEPIDIALRKAA